MLWSRRKKALPDKGFRGIPMPFSSVGDVDVADYRGIPTLMCPCGYNMVVMCAVFNEETRLPGFYLLDGKCAACGAWLTLPTEIDERIEI